MAESAVRTDKRFQLMVYGGIAVLSALIMGTSLAFLHDSTIFWAAAILLVGLLVTIAFLALEL